MRDVSARHAPSAESLRRASWKSGDAARWTLGIVITVVAIGALLLAIVLAPASIRANNSLCLEQIANDEHINLEAFFQSPVEQDAFVQAVAVCSR